MKFKDYQKMDSFALEQFMKELLDSGIIKNQEQKKEMRKIYEQLKEQNIKAIASSVAHEIIKNKLF